MPEESSFQAARLAESREKYADCARDWREPHSGSSAARDGAAKVRRRFDVSPGDIAAKGIATERALSGPGAGAAQRPERSARCVNPY